MNTYTTHTKTIPKSYTHIHKSYENLQTTIIHTITYKHITKSYTNHTHAMYKSYKQIHKSNNNLQHEDNIQTIQKQ